MTTCLGKSCSFGLPRVHFVNCCQLMLFSYFLFGFEGRMWDLIVSVPDHCLPFYFMVDNVFRDASEVLKEFGINSHMPHFFNKSQKQHSTEEANEGRLVTNVRWVVESVNGRIKNGKRFYNGHLPTSYNKHIRIQITF